MPDETTLPDACSRTCGYEDPALEIARLRRRERELCCKLAERTQEREQARACSRTLLTCDAATMERLCAEHEWLDGGHGTEGTSGTSGLPGDPGKE